MILLGCTCTHAGCSVLIVLLVLLLLLLLLTYAVRAPVACSGSCLSDVPVAGLGCRFYVLTGAIV
jgi:hypothetical protein